MKNNIELDREKIRQCLPYGCMKRIAEKEGVSQAVVSQWFSGLFNSDRIEKAVLSEYERQIKLTQKRMTRYKKLSLA